MDGAPMLDSLIEVFPQVNVLTLTEASINFKGDIEAAAYYVIQNVLPNMAPQPSHPNTNGLHQQVSEDDTSNHLGIDPVDDILNSNTIQTYLNNEIVVKQLKQSSTDLGPEVSTSGEDHISEGFCSDSLLADSQLQHSSEANVEISASEGDMSLSLHNNGSPDMIMASNYSVNILESLDDFIADEQHKKVTLLSNAAAISEMLQAVELNEEKTKHAILAVGQAGNDMLRKADELKEITALVMDDNDKVSGEIFSEKSILATEALKLQTRLFNISEETRDFELTIEEMHSTLQRRLAACEEDRAAAEKAKLEREASAQKILTEQQLSLEAATKRFSWLEQQAQVNAKLKESLVGRGHAVDTLQGEMLGIFDSITELKRKVGMKFPIDEQSLPSSAIFYQCDEPLQQVPSSLSSSPVDVPVQPVSSDSFLKSASSKSSSMESLASKSSWSSFAESSSKEDEKIDAELSEDYFSLDDSWDVVSNEDEASSPKRCTTPVQL